jgi:hypothetical protein
MLARGDGSKLLLKGLARRVATARILKLLPCQMLRGEREKEKRSHRQRLQQAQRKCRNNTTTCAMRALYTPGASCLKVTDMLMGATTALPGKFSGSWPAWMASVPNEGNGGRCAIFCSASAEKVV